MNIESAINNYIEQSINVKINDKIYRKRVIEKIYFNKLEKSISENLDIQLSNEPKKDILDNLKLVILAELDSINTYDLQVIMHNLNQKLIKAKELQNYAIERNNWNGTISYQISGSSNPKLLSRNLEISKQCTDDLIIANIKIEIYELFINKIEEKLVNDDLGYAI